MPKTFALAVACLFFLIESRAHSAVEDTNIIIAQQNEFYTFEYNKQGDRIDVQQQLYTKYFCNQFRTSLPVVETYNDFTTINNVSIYVNGSKTTSIKPLYDYYSVSDVFYSDARVCYFTLPLEKKGSNSEVRFEKTVQDPRYFTTIFFSEGYKVANKTVVVAIPSWMKVELKEYNIQGYSIVKSSTYDSRKDADILTYTITDLPARVSEDAAPGPTYLYPHLLVLTKSASVGGKEFTYFKTIKEQYDWVQGAGKRFKNGRSIDEGQSGRDNSGKIHRY